MALQGISYACIKSHEHQADPHEIAKGISDLKNYHFEDPNKLCPTIIDYKN